jgi:serine/threonine-protein kinase
VSKGDRDLVRLDGAFVLSPNVELLPLKEYSRAARARLGGRPGDHVLTELRSRYAAQRIDEESAAFLRRFERPCTMAEAIVAHAQARGESPAELLDAVLPFACEMRARRVLVEPSGLVRRAVTPRFAAGDQHAGALIEVCLDAQTETEVYQVRTAGGERAVLKVIPADAPAFVHRAGRREVAALRRLRRAGMEGVPTLLAASASGREPSLLISWCEGRDLPEVALDRSVSQARRAMIAVNLAERYAELHACGFLHGDVHPRNVRVDDEGTVRLIDFGAAAPIGDSTPMRRLGVLLAYEPEVAASILAGVAPPPSTPAGEQHSVATMVYLVLSGASSLRLSLEQRAALEQIARQPPRPLVEVGLRAPAVERVLRRALSKDPKRRFESMAAFSAALRAALARDGVASGAAVGKAGPSAPRGKRDSMVASEGRARSTRSEVASFLHHGFGITAEATRTGLQIGPSASLYYGGAGIAYALLRLALLNADAEALAAADIWITNAVAQRSRRRAFEGEDVGLPQGSGVPRSLFNGLSGVYAVEVLVRAALSDDRGVERAVARFVGLHRPRGGTGRAQHPGSDDVIEGQPGALLALATLREVCAHRPAARALLEPLGDRLADRLQGDLARESCWQGPYLGFAHGPAGALHALLRWGEAMDRPSSEVTRDGLDRLAGMARKQSRGTAWPVGPSDPNLSWTGWCHGSAGYLLLWTLAWRRSGEGTFRRLAVGAGQRLWWRRGAAGASLCCGAAGQSLAVMTFARAMDDRAWLRRASALAEEAWCADAPSPSSLTEHSLFRGRVGAGLAVLESAADAASVWPFCTSLRRAT